MSHRSPFGRREYDSRLWLGFLRWGVPRLVCIAVPEVRKALSVKERVWSCDSRDNLMLSSTRCMLTLGVAISALARRLR